MIFFPHSSVTDTKSYRTSSKEREATFEVFPQHQTTRLDDEGILYLMKDRIYFITHDKSFFQYTVNTCDRSS